MVQNNLMTTIFAIRMMEKMPKMDKKIYCLLLFHCGSHEVRAHQMSGMNVDYQTVLHACSLLNSLLLKYAATLQCKVKLTSFINSILYWHL